MGRLEMTMHPAMDQLASHHPATMAATEELLGALRDVDALTVGERERSSTAQKGVATDIVAACTAPAVVGGLVAVVRLWLKRDKRRSVKCSVKIDGETVLEAELSGEGLSDEAVREIMDRLLPRKESAQQILE